VTSGTEANRSEHTLALFCEHFNANSRESSAGTGHAFYDAVFGTGAVISPKKQKFLSSLSEQLMLLHCVQNLPSRKTVFPNETE
jgi:hypothetical protein